MLHSFFLCDREGRILVSKYFDAAAVHRDERALWEQEVFQVSQLVGGSVIQKIKKIRDFGRLY